MTDAAVPSGPVTRSSVAKVGVATAVTAVCGYTVLYLAARDLDPAGFSIFGVFWGAFGLVSGAALGLLQQSTREIRIGTQVDPAHRPITRPLRVAAVVGVVAAVVIAGTAPLWSPHVFVESQLLSVVLLAVGLAGFCVHSALLGVLAGGNRWAQYGTLMVGDAGSRVAIAAVTVAVGWGLVGFLWATVCGAFTWVVLLIASPTTRDAAAHLVAHDDIFSFLRGTGHAVAAAGASAILVTGFPVLLKATSGDLGPAGGVVILAVTLTRAPLLVPLTSMQGNLIAHFVDQRKHRLRALISPAAMVLVVGAAGVVLAWLTGPWLLRTGFGADYVASGELLAGLTAGAVAIALLTLTGAATVAAALHRAYSVGWICATIASALLLTLPLALQTRTVVALLCGPVVGIAVHLVALGRRRGLNH